MRVKTWLWLHAVALAAGAMSFDGLAAAELSAEQAADTRPAADVARFSFGPPTSVTRVGFTKVTDGDAFTPGKAFGFESTQGLLAYDRGGAEITQPKDEYTARA